MTLMVMIIADHWSGG